ncbi:MAG: RidA family protein [Pseudonocardiales bacterium]|nr:RidA family protein [Pseudonocardiales bacterium]
MNPSRRLRDLGMDLPQVAAPAGAYLPAVRTGSLVFTAGQLPIVDGRLAATGRVGAEIDVERGAELARACALNALAAVDALVGLDAIERVVKITGFVASAPDFYAQPAVLDGASTLIGEIFGAAGGHARSAIGVAQLPKNAPVEVEVVVQVTTEVSP